MSVEDPVLQDPAPADPVAATRAAWIAAERAIRARLAAPGRVSPAELARDPGLDFFARISRGELPSVPIGATLDFVPIDYGAGWFVFQATPSGAHYNPLGSVHGGYIATLLDSAVGCAVHTTLDRGTGYTTLELKVNYVRALTDRVGPVRAEGKVIHVSRQVATAEGRLVDAAGRLYAHATTTCLLFPLPTPSTAAAA